MNSARAVRPNPPEVSDRQTNRREYQERTSLLTRIAACYPPIPRVYSLLRFTIIRARILGVMDVLLPERGDILELGCGFGLFAGYFAASSRERTLFGVDRNEKRIDMARQMAARMKLPARFEVADVRELPETQTFDAAYALDVLHHIPFDAHRTVLEDLHRRLKPGATLLVKDISTFPLHKLGFTWLLDRVMAPEDQLSYRHHEDWAALLREVGFEVRIRHLDDYLPYPHVLLICTRLP
jgi:2-polyprenyl-3-methyl-5-hydroxy-6-metoxy-1,4-benzoquinol methylase